MRNTFWVKKISEFSQIIEGEPNLVIRDGEIVLLISKSVQSKKECKEDGGIYHFAFKSFSKNLAFLLPSISF